MPIVPQSIVYTHAEIYKNLPPTTSVVWVHAASAAACKRTDFSLIMEKFVLWMLQKELPLHNQNPEFSAAITAVEILYEKLIAGGELRDIEWEQARCAADELRNAAGTRAHRAWNAAAGAPEIWAEYFASQAISDAAYIHRNPLCGGHMVRYTLGAAEKKLTEKMPHRELSQRTPAAVAAREESASRMAAKMLELLTADQTQTTKEAA